jgi:hypothetical protein
MPLAASGTAIIVEIKQGRKITDRKETKKYLGKRDKKIRRKEWKRKI